MIAFSASAWGYLVLRQTELQHRPGIVPDLLHWTVMVTAMMLPLQVRTIRLTAEQSIWSRRDRAIAAHVGGYVGFWVVCGLPLAWADAKLHLTHRIDWTQGAAIGFMMGAAWLLSPWKATAGRQCHRTSRLSPSGWKADFDCIRYGCVSGYWCACNCWPLMIVCWLSGHNLVVTLFSFGLGWHDRHFSPSARGHALLLATIGSISWACSFVFPTRHP